MLTRAIPKTGEPMPVIGVGTWQTFDIGDDAAALAQRRQVLETLIAGGGTVIDSSPMYGRAEAVVGRLLTEMQARDKVFLATKVWTSGERAGLAQMQASADRMRAAVIDLMQIHNLVDWRTHLASLRKGKAAGAYRYIGITHYTTGSLDELARIIRAEDIDFVQLGLSLGTRDAAAKVLPVAAERGVGVIVNQPFDSGSAFGKLRRLALPAWAADFGATTWGQVMLKYILANPAVTCVIPGTASPEHMRDNLAAGVGALPDAAQCKRIEALWDAL